MNVRVKENVKKKLARTSLTWAGHADRMGDEPLAESRCSESGGEKRRKRT